MNTERERAESLQSHKPIVEFEDPRVQLVYGIICGGHEPPEGEHWDGYVSRLIVEALQSQDREDALVQAIQEAIALLGPEAPSCCGCEYEWNHALRVLREAIDHARRIEETHHDE